MTPDEAKPVTPPVGSVPREATPATPPQGRTSLLELALLFGRLGTTAFGGPAAHIAMMEDEVVRRRKWLSEERFLDLLGATNLIPGPNSTEMAIHIGYERRRWLGLLVAGACFILPASLVTVAFAWAYVRFGTRPTAAWFLYGVKPVVIAVVVQAIRGLAPKAARDPFLRVLCGLSILFAWAGVHEIPVLLGAGLVAAARGRLGRRGEGRDKVYQVSPFVPVAALSVANTMNPSTLFWVFFKIGSVLFGSGYVLLAFLRAELVDRLGWLDERALVDAVAVGQLTPGPVFTTATFVGYVLRGPKGALAATTGIFLPAFVFVALSGPLVPRLRASPLSGAFLDGVNVASLALMSVVTVRLVRAAVVDVPTLLLGVTSVLLLLRFKANSTWLVLGGAVAGWFVHGVGAVR